MMENFNIREIAQQLNCSPSTVSRVLSGRQSGTVKISEKTRRRILDFCAGKNYTPSIHAARFFSKRSRTVGFLNDSGLEFDPNLSLSLFTVCNELFARNYRCLPLQNSERFIREQEYCKIFERQEIDGWIIWGANTRYQYLDQLQQIGCPFLLLTNRLEDYPAIYTNQSDPVAQMVRHCKKQGASRFALLCHDDGDSYRQRAAGFYAEAGDNYKLFRSPQSFENGYRFGAELLDYRPDAIICANDFTAVGVEKYLLEHNVRIPQDVMLTGGDNQPVSRYCTVPITTFDQQTRLCAQICVRQMLDHLENDQPLHSFEQEAQLLFRVSTTKI